ncbi:alpha-1,2-fucosyltransferase [Dysgonomonas sp. Marseille-P4677]|uniref:alpha-1,2-fucosyltransferase n=1 Tax=Dysgonomonas sp. Marseille-P4677 TaxID=2364790 RepID=UPI0019117EF1|nr:alpha-1,2-fucosyltransferase [Dysgonomonas sp. Marseille-P4677]MBK5720418.1 alpha-1,2-fucosyltransferase [Dysgonomonas sp. Marseille-P4677]
MVSILLSGGLGNQMFQYAAAKALAKRLDSSLNIDLYNLTKKTKATVRSYELDIFDINAPIKSTIKGKLFIKMRPFIQKHRSFFQHLGLLTDTYALQYEPIIETIKGNVTMSGYFQSERYFQDIKSDIFKDFTFKNPLGERNLEVAEQIAQSESIAIHIRRGDYITDKGASLNFVTCGKEYYQKAIAYIARKIQNPIFYVFSEDMDWVRKNLNFESYQVLFIDWNRDKESYLDMQLMSRCKHNIIANSSFSWWAAWLNRNSQKIVIAPEKWFQEDFKNLFLDDFYPNGWVKI